MSITNEVAAKVQELRELRRMADELAGEISAIQGEITGLMDLEDVDELAGVDWKVTWKTVKSSRVDTAALKKALPDVAQAFTRETTTRRFCVA
ncbi:MAG: hypothetical protein IJ751_01410 [Oscillospiraceae bacterium]|nr:hypothetical protein [Oscillospiraceae bacterium]